MENAKKIVTQDMLMLMEIANHALLTAILVIPCQKNLAEGVKAPNYFTKKNVEMIVQPKPIMIKTLLVLIA
jgi:hypothetical protein